MQTPFQKRLLGAGALCSLLASAAAQAQTPGPQQVATQVVVVTAGGLGARAEMRADEGDLIYGVEQKLPLFGKPRLAQRLAQEGWAVERADADYRFQALRRDLAKALFRAALAERVVEVGTEALPMIGAAPDPETPAPPQPY